MDLLRQAVRLMEQGVGGVMATIVAREGSGARPAGTRMIVLESGETRGSLGGGTFEARVIEEAGKIFLEHEPRLFSYVPEDQADRCGGQVQVFLEPLQDLPFLLIIGSGHVGQALAAVASLARFRILVVDDRPEPAGNWPRGVRYHRVDLADVFRDIRVNRETCLVICTRTHALDYGVLEQALATPARYIGLLGSKKKRTSFFSRLREKGVSENELRRVACPVGLDIGAVTPEEIGISIVAELIGRRHLL